MTLKSPISEVNTMASNDNYVNHWKIKRSLSYKVNVDGKFEVGDKIN